MPMPNALFASGVLRDSLDGQINFDQSLRQGSGHFDSPPIICSALVW